MRVFYTLIIAIFFLITGCAEKKPQQMTPWGTPLGGDSVSVSNQFSLGDIVTNGEMIMLTMSGPETYYDYHGKGMGLQYLLCEKFADKLGVKLRVEACKDTAEMVRRLKNGEADIIAFQLPKTYKGVEYAGAKNDSLKTSWAVQAGNEELADSLNSWYRPSMIAEVRKEESFFLSTRSIVRHVYSPMLNRAGGVISKWDKYFMMYAPVARWDWRLMAAQCYQESTFDPQAHSWAGACGLMQIMPSTADHLGLSRANLYDPEQNIAAAAKYIRELSDRFGDIPNRMEQYNFVLACYNGGYHHVRDAMALAKKYGRNPYRWSDVSEFVLKLRMPTYYNDPVVKYGYMRGDETVDYVQRIRARWAQYRGFAASGSSSVMGGMGAMPHKAKHKNRYAI